MRRKRNNWERMIGKRGGVMEGIKQVGQGHNSDTKSDTH
jgi:hypothetical protein